MTTAQQAFAGGTAVVTGAGSGIGEGLARVAGRLGMNVVVADIDASRAERVAASIREAGGDAIAMAVDVSIPRELDLLADRAYEVYGDVRLLVNNAGIETLGLAWEIPSDAWERSINVNFHGVVHGVRAFVPRMLASGNPAWVANLASVGAFSHGMLHSAYLSTKHAVLAFTESLYLDIQYTGAPVHVSAVVPGPVASRIYEDARATDTALVVRHREMMRQYQGAGIPIEDAGHIILEQVAAGNFFVSTHPEMTSQYAQGRADYLSRLQAPELSEQARQMFAEQ